MTVTGPWTVEDDPPPTGADGSPLSPRGASTRRKLLDVAERTFAEYGWYDASIVKITEAAGVAQGTFYSYFASKQEVFDEIVVDLNRRVRRAMSEASAQGATRAERERLGFRAFFDFTATHPSLYRIVRQAEFASPGALHLHYERIAQGYVAGLRAAMAEGEIVAADPVVLAWALMGVGELVGMRYTFWGDTKAVPDEVFEQLLGFITRGLGAADGG